MTQPDSKRLAWLFMATLATTTAMMASSASAQSKPAQVPGVGGGIQPPSLPPTSPNAFGPPLRNTLDNCMAFWDAETHMSKTEWRAACRRMLSGTGMDMMGLDESAPDHPATREGRRYRGRAAGARR
jgi:hypothetical protein